MNLHYLLAAVIMTLSTTQVLAGMSFGGADCGQWFNKQQRPKTKIWLSGYLSGVNAGIGEQYGDPMLRLNSM